MSRTSPSEVVEYAKNPAVATIEWNAQHGEFSMWDNLNKVKSIINKPMKFAVLDQLASVEGWMDEKGTALSNEFRRANENIKVYLYKDGDSRIHKEGSYTDLKDGLKNEGITYRKVIYAMLCDDIDDVPVGSIVKIKLKGKSANLWIEGKYSDNSNLVAEGNQTIGRFKYPVFKEVELNKDEIENAEDADKELQNYFHQSVINVSNDDVKEEDTVYLSTSQEGMVASEDIPF